VKVMQEMIFMESIHFCYTSTFSSQEVISISSARWSPRLMALKESFSHLKIDSLLNI